MGLFICNLAADEVGPLALFEVSPNPMDKLTHVNLAFISKVHVSVTIEDNESNIVKTLYTGDINSGNFMFFWDRLNDNGELVPAGKYYVNVCYDNRYTSTKKTLILK